MLPFHRPPPGAVLRLSLLAALAACALVPAVSERLGLWAVPDSQARKLFDGS